MVDRNLVKSIVGTYDLSPRLKDKITGIASRRIDELYIKDFSGMYRYIAELIEKFKIPFGERVMLRLDKPLFFNSETTLHNFLGFDDSAIRSMLEGGEKEELAFEDAIDLLRGRIDSLDLRLLRQMSDKDEMLKLGISSERILAAAPLIQERLEALAKKYEKDGRLLIPKRPIINIRFNPLLIRFGNRRYNGIPLAFFMKHEDVYDGLSRGQLANLDGGLYDALRKTKQLEIAILEADEATVEMARHFRKREFKKLQKKFNIIVAYKTYKGSALEASKHLPYAKETMLRYWRDAGLETNLKGNPLQQPQIDGIVNAYELYNGSASKASRYLPHTKKTILEYWRDAGLEIRKNGRPKIS